ncbi:MAG TPA: hypothetical protein VFK80_06075, partial [Limnochordia bacterium]|nr:hypothetical protein [Limnochordia bacterium]
PGETATEANIRAQAASTRFEDKIKRFEYEFIRPMGRMWADLNQMFLDQEVVVRIEGEKGFDFRTIRPEDIAGDFDIEVRGANVDAEVSPSQHRQDFIQLLQALNGIVLLIAKTQPQALQKINWFEILRYAVKLFEPERVDEFTAEDQPAQGNANAPQLLGPNGRPIASVSAPGAPGQAQPPGGMAGPSAPMPPPGAAAGPQGLPPDLIAALAAQGAGQPQPMGAPPNAPVGAMQPAGAMQGAPGMAGSPEGIAALIAALAASQQQGGVPVG